MPHLSSVSNRIRRRPVSSFPGDQIGGAGSFTASDVVFVPAGGVSSTNVQAAIEELDTKKASLAHVKKLIYLRI